jgi:hypothetical protein
MAGSSCTKSFALVVLVRYILSYPFSKDFRGPSNEVNNSGRLATSVPELILGYYPS